MKLFRRRLLNGVSVNTEPEPIPTYTIKVYASPTAGGSVIAKSGSNSNTTLSLTSGTSYSISATTGNSGYEFNKWTSNESTPTTYTDREKTGLIATKNINWTASYDTVASTPVLTVEKRPEDAQGSVHIGSTSSSTTSSGITEGTSVNIYASNSDPYYVIQWEHDDEILPVTLSSTYPYPAILNVTMPSSSTTYTAYMDNLTAENLVLNIFVGYETINGRESYFFKFLYEVEGASEATKRLYLLGEHQAADPSFDYAAARDPELYLAKNNIVTDEEDIKVLYTGGTTYDVGAGNGGVDTTWYKTWYFVDQDSLNGSIILPPLFIPSTWGSSYLLYQLQYKKFTLRWWIAKNNYSRDEDSTLAGRTVFNFENINNCFYIFKDATGSPITNPTTWGSPQTIKNIQFEFRPDGSFRQFLDEIKSRANFG